MKPVKLLKDTDVLGQEKSARQQSGIKKNMTLYVIVLFVIAVAIFLLLA